MYQHVFACSILLLACACNYGQVRNDDQVQLVGEPLMYSPADPQDPNYGKAMEIVGGDAHVCALIANDRVRCWGDNDHGQCNLKAARNASKKLYDVSNAQFSKISSGSFFSCGILKGGALDKIPLCFGKEGEWLDVPHEKVKDIAAGPNFTCFIKNDDKLGCVGPSILLLRRSEYISIKAKDLPKHGIEDIREGLDFSQKSFISLKASDGRLCAQGVDGIVYCMGFNSAGFGISIAEKVSDYHIHSYGTYFLLDNGDLTSAGAWIGFGPLNNVRHPNNLKYKKFLGEAGLLTAAGNTYDDGSTIPENTLIPYQGEIVEGVLGAVEMLIRRRNIGSILIRCMIKNNHKIKCGTHYDNYNEVKNELIIKNLPTELAY